MTCQKCHSKRVANLNAKCSDCCSVSIGTSDHDGYVPKGLGIGGGDYVEFSYCLDCGQLQGKFPLPSAEIEKDIGTEEVRDFFENHFTPGECLDKFYGRWIADIIEHAKELSPKFGKFMTNFFRFNDQQNPPLLMPTAQVFVEMYKANKPELIDY